MPEEEILSGSDGELSGSAQDQVPSGSEDTLSGSMIDTAPEDAVTPEDDVDTPTIHVQFSFTAHRGDTELVRMEKDYDCPDNIEAFKSLIRTATPGIQNFLVDDVTLDSMFQGEVITAEELALQQFQKFEQQIQAQVADVIAAKKQELGIV